MDGKKHTLTGTKDMEWLTRIEGMLREAFTRQDVPALEIEWLLGRCADTRTMQGDWLLASLSQLEKDVEAFRAEFPGILEDV